MAIKQLTISSAGLSGVYPRLIYLLTDDTLSQVTESGFLNLWNSLNPGQLTDGDMALVITKPFPSSSVVNTGFLQVNFSNEDWSLIQPSFPGFVSVATQVFTSSGTYTPTDGMLYCIVEALGGGGGGGGSVAGGGQVGVGGGGGAGGYCIQIFTAAQIGVSKSVTVGVGGSGGSDSGTSGSSGADTLFGLLLTANAGTGGSADNNKATYAGASQGVGGTGVGGYLNVTGQNGAVGWNTTVANVPLNSGYGANSIYGAGGIGGFGGDGANATGYGSGGSGGSATAGTGHRGGNGSPGIVIVTEYIN